MTFASFTQDVERRIDDPFAIADRLKSLLAADGWLAPDHRLADREARRRHVLHVSDCRRLSVAALVWLPGQPTPIPRPHVVVRGGGLSGIQRQAQIAMIERNWKLCLVSAGTFEAPAVGEGKTISIHVYGADIERLSWRRYDDTPQLLPGPDRRFRAA